ncbi:MAG: chromosomal replication initiator protein DnaA [Salaquimonas sp.]|nr:chromosomal replication initiator protein DnaA [Salaquimonas sp.]
MKATKRDCAAGGAGRTGGHEAAESGPEQEQWRRICQQLQARLGKEVFNSWFGRMKLEWISGGVAQHTVPTAFLKNWTSSHYRELLTELWKAENADVLRVDIAMRSAIRRVLRTDQDEDATIQGAAREADAKTVRAAQPANVPVPTGIGAARRRSSIADRTPGFAGSPLDPRHSFASFIEGRSNRMACAAARTVADDDKGSVRFNPLFIHASVGLGKTHLLQAIAWGARGLDPSKKLLYLTAEYFMWRFASAIRDQTALQLKESLRDIDLLLIDDMQFLQGKAIQAEFCHLLNELIDSARQVVVAADRPPAELESLDERVRSRLKGGVTLEIEAPDYEMRKSILFARYEEVKHEQPALEIPEDILTYVARQVTTSGRDVEGAFNQLLVQHRFCDGPMSFEELDKMLGHLIRSGDARRVRVEDIQKVVARHYNVSKNELLSNRRTRAIVRPRQIAMYLAKVLTPRSLPEIGRRFGGRDHTTVLHAVRKIEDLVANDQKLAREVELLKRLVLD